MEDGRLGEVSRGIRKNRKLIYVMNEIIKNKQKLYENNLDRETEHTVYKMAASEFKARKAALMSRVLLQCLNISKQQLSDPSHISDFGMYGGRPLDSFSKDIDQWLAWQHPRLRRLRKVDRIKRKCLDQGEIMNEEVAKSKIGQFFQQLRDDEERKRQAKRRLETKPQRKLRWRGGLPVYDDEKAREGDFPDPHGTVKRSQDINPFEKLAGLIPNHYKADLLKPLWVDTPRHGGGQGTPTGGSSEDTPKGGTGEVMDMLQSGRDNQKYDRLPSIDSSNKTHLLGSNSSNSRNSANNSKKVPPGIRRHDLDQQPTVIGHSETGDSDNGSANSGDPHKMTRVRTLVLPPIMVTKKVIK